jgi:hypothetical protein
MSLINMIKHPDKDRGEAGTAKSACPASLVPEWEREGWVRESAGGQAAAMADIVQEQVRLALAGAGLTPAAGPTSPPPPPTVAVAYYYMDGETRRGPLSADELVSAGLERDAWVWSAGLPAWTTAGAVTELAARLPPPPPPAPPARPVKVAEGA